MDALQYSGPTSPPAPTSVTFSVSVSPHDSPFYQMKGVFEVINQCNLEKVVFNVHCNQYDTSVSYPLKLFNTKIFEWTAPDSENQVSLAITESAARFLTLGCATRWSRLQSIKLVGITCARDSIFDAFDAAVQPDLRQIEIGQAVQVKALSIIRSLARVPQLAQMRLVDVYMGSIWENRLRMEDLQNAFNTWQQDPASRRENEHELTWDDVVQRVKCLVKKQRLEGGDRGADMETD
ncbi:hypothetical protein FRB90_008133 [Tulasnella sp. 427]|nr:hypothetical protein FRB90_008133 [Tulasnella sp. 427]